MQPYLRDGAPSLARCFRLRRYREAEGAPLPRRAVHHDAPAMGLRRQLAEGEAEAPVRCQPLLFELELSELLENQRKCFDWLYLQLNIHRQEEWFLITADDVKTAGGGGLLAHYSGSLNKALEAVFPQAAPH